MTSAVSATIAWPIIVAMTLVVGARWRWFASSTSERYLNTTLTIILATQLLRERAIQHAIAEHTPLSVTAIQQLTLCTIVCSIAPFLCVVGMLSGWNVEHARRQCLRYAFVAVALSALMLIAGTRARRAHMPVEITGGWDGVLVWVGFSVLPTYLAYVMVSRCRTEYRQPGVIRSEKLVLAGIAAAGATIGVTTAIALVLAVLQELHLLDSVEYRMQTHPRNFFWIAAAIVAVSAAPPLRSATRWLGYDTTSRQWRQLRPLWQAMVSLFPDSRLPLGPGPSERRITTLQLHRATVEIRDAMLGLRSFAHDVEPDVFATFTAREHIPRSEWDTATLALQLARAAHDRREGIAPRAETATPLPTSTSANLADEVSELLRLAKWWSPAHRFVAADRSASHRPAESPTQKT
ncbi:MULTISPECIES: MAB_1171c family putative transporter [Nocardia]|uniref:MAB_1171c family putative transporter n=1 Tax=Nocardia TaxID=1817 RepID=UPI002657C8E4|nr:MAB_1171c family putative transporter [Nocardia sp. PE-7]WKG08868.1 hypothetical protein QX204_28135 [Nocardia sp. PE-7]